VTQGFRDLLEIGYQSRPKLFELGIRKPELLYDEVVEISERITVEGFDEDVHKDSRPSPKESPGLFVKGVTGDILRIIRPLDEAEVREKLEGLRAKGIDTIAICLAHSYMYPTHEDRIAEMASQMGFTHVSKSSSVGASMIKMISRGSSASADAYLTPEIVRYVDGFSKAFEGGNLDGVSCEFMQSDGGLVNHQAFSGLRGILSGPAGKFSFFFFFSFSLDLRCADNLVLHRRRCRLCEDFLRRVFACGRVRHGGHFYRCQSLRRLV
jgi:5-oxoprolinase (ATP-hydrolysing)